MFINGFVLNIIPIIPKKEQGNLTPPYTLVYALPGRPPGEGWNHSCSRHPRWPSETRMKKSLEFDDLMSDLNYKQLQELL